MFECPASKKLNEIYDYYIFDQGMNLDCAVAAAISLVEYLRQKEGKKCEKFSVSFLYHNLLNKSRLNSGFKASTVLDTLLKKGVCTNSLWSEKNSLIKPSYEAIIDGFSRIKNCNIEYIENSIECIRYIIGFCERPIVALLNIYDFMSFKCGVKIDKPKKLDVICAKHSVLLVGYDDDKKIIYFQNSYGTGWGKNGFGELSYDYISCFGILYSMDESCIKSEGELN